MSDFLDQSDIDRLIAEGATHRFPVFTHTGDSFADPESISIEPFDFRTPVFLAEAELRRLRMVHQDYISTLSVAFSDLLRTDVNLKMSKLTTMTFGRFQESMRTPSHIALFRVQSLPGIGIFEIPPSMALSLANRMLGGKGLSTDGSRYLTEIEIALLDELIAIVLREWCMQWREEKNLAATQLGYESNPRFLQICSNDTAMLILGIEGLAGDMVDEMQIAIPYMMIEPIIKNMQAGRNRELELSTAKPKPSWRAPFEQIDVPITVDWVVGQVQLGDAIQLRVGDVLELPRETLSRAQIRVATKPRFLATVGIEASRVVAQIHSEKEKINS
jgi:flagellar motor switch protein FliM